jgi:hypothetical protein
MPRDEGRVGVRGYDRTGAGSRRPMPDLRGHLIQVLALCDMLVISLERVVDEIQSVELREEISKTAEGVRAELSRLSAEFPSGDDLPR